MGRQFNKNHIYLQSGFGCDFKEISIRIMNNNKKKNYYNSSDMIIIIYIVLNIYCIMRHHSILYKFHLLSKI